MGVGVETDVGVRVGVGVGVVAHGLHAPTRTPMTSTKERTALSVVTKKVLRFIPTSLHQAPEWAGYSVPRPIFLR